MGEKMFLLALQTELNHHQALFVNATNVSL